MTALRTALATVAIFALLVALPAAEEANSTLDLGGELTSSDELWARFWRASGAAESERDSLETEAIEEKQNAELALKDCSPVNFEPAMRRLQQIKNDLGESENLLWRWSQFYQEFVDLHPEVRSRSSGIGPVLTKVRKNGTDLQAWLDRLQEEWDKKCKKKVADALPGGAQTLEAESGKKFRIVDAIGDPIAGGTLTLVPRDNRTTPRRMPTEIKIAEDGTLDLTPEQVAELKDYRITIKPKCHLKVVIDPNDPNTVYIGGTGSRLIKPLGGGEPLLINPTKVPLKLWFFDAMKVTEEMIADALRRNYNARLISSETTSIEKPYIVHHMSALKFDPVRGTYMVEVTNYELLDPTFCPAPLGIGTSFNQDNIVLGPRRPFAPQSPFGPGFGPGSTLPVVGDGSPNGVTNVIAPDGKTVIVESDQFRIVKGQPPNDPLANSRRTWGQNFPDQWYLKAVGWLKNDGTTVLPEKAHLVTVAVIDTGVDFKHPELIGARWVNPKPGPRGDRYGWNFVDDNADTSDNSGHGTHIAGVIAAANGNGLGIAGINPWARIMALKAMDLDGTGGSIDLARAIIYAAEHGARVINLSVGGRRLTRHEQVAINFADSKGALVVVAAGNEGDDTAKHSPAGLKNVLTVAVVGPDLKRRPFSNWGRNVAIAAPGVEVLSLRARRTDALIALNPAYKPGNAIVKSEYYRMSGTSFATPIVSGAASLLFSINPKLTPEQVKRMLLQSARDLDGIGTNQFSGYGLLDIEAAVNADPNFFIEARIAGVSVAKVRGRQVVRMSGTANANQMKQARIEIGAGDSPKRWKRVGRTIGKPVVEGVLGDVPADSFRGSKQWTLRVIVTHRNGRTRETRFKLSLG